MNANLIGHAGLYFRANEIEWEDDGLYVLTSFGIWRRVKTIEKVESLMKAGREVLYISSADLHTDN